MTKHDFSQQITFLHAHTLSDTREFYTEKLGLTVVRDQSTCLIFRVTDQAYLGFCEHIEEIQPGRKVILTLVTEDIDQWYELLTHRGVKSLDSPKYNPKYQIYHFFLRDPNGYWIEIQRFDTPL